MRGRPSSARAAALIAGGALVVHELRYLLAPTGAGGHGGHAYLPLLHLFIALALAGACVQLAVLVGRARRRARDPRRSTSWSPGRHNVDPTSGAATVQARPPCFLAMWALAAAAVLAVFTGQELIEGGLAAGRTPGLGAVFAAGGSIAPLLALGAGLAVAAGLRGADAAIAAASRRAGAGADSSIHPPLARSAAPVVPRRRAPALADHLAGRAPPLTA